MAGTGEALHCPIRRNSHFNGLSGVAGGQFGKGGAHRSLDRWAVRGQAAALGAQQGLHTGGEGSSGVARSRIGRFAEGGELLVECGA